MNKYFRKWIISTLLNQKYIFILMITQLAIATLILSIFFSASFGINYNLTALLQEQENITFFINPIHADEDAFDPFAFNLFAWGNSEIVLNEYANLPINQYDLQYLRQHFPELRIDLLVAVNLAVLTEYGTTFTILYDSSLDSVQVTTGFYELFQLETHDHIINKRDLHFFYANNQIKTLDDLAFSIENIYDTFDPEVESIRLPIAAYYNFHHPRDVINTRLQVQIRADAPQEDLQEVAAILQYLHEQNGSYFNYYLSSDLAEFFTRVASAQYDSEVFTMISLILLLVVSIGMSASFVILLNRHKKEIATMLAIGVTKWQLYRLVITLPLIISSLGALIGLLFCFIILSRGFKVATVTVYLNIFVLIGVFIFLQTLSFLAVLPMVLKINKLMPIEFLHSE